MPPTEIDCHIVGCTTDAVPIIRYCSFIISNFEIGIASVQVDSGNFASVVNRLVIVRNRTSVIVNGVAANAPAVIKPPIGRFNFQCFAEIC